MKKRYNMQLTLREIMVLDMAVILTIHHNKRSLGVDCLRILMNFHNTACDIFDRVDGIKKDSHE